MPTGRDPRLLRVMSYNLKDFTADRAAAARVVRGVDPDVLCLQEVPRRLTTEFRLPSFARECGLLWGGGRGGTGGTALLTSMRTRVHGTSRARLRVRFPDRTRGYAALDVSLPGALPLTVVSVHLSLRADERERHAATILEGLGDRTIVAGDLNEGSDGRAYGRFVGRFAKVSGERPTFPSHAPRHVLDVVFAGPGVRVVAVDSGLDDTGDESARVLRAEDLAAGSDHLPVWVDIDLGSSRTP